MLSTILLSFLAFWIIFLPIYLWGYGTTFVLGYGWQRVRFFMGIFIGALSVGLIYLLELFKWSDTLAVSWGILVILLLFFYGLIYILTHYGSPYARVFLRRIALGHIILIFLIIAGLLLLASIFPLLVLPVSLSLALLIASLFEEASKHLVSIGLAGQDFHFSRGDIITFTLFSVLWFVFSENLIYLIGGEAPLAEWVYRSLFTLIAHIFAASLCAYFWWKALSYELFSVRYIAYFVLGFLLASGAHMLYNGLLTVWSLAWLIIYTVLGYMMMVVMFAKK